MEPFSALTFFQGGVLGLNTAAVLLLYKMHRDIRDVAKTSKHHWEWIERLRQHVWPKTFPPIAGRWQADDDQL